MDFRPKPHWTPRYIRDRLTLHYHQTREPELPWWPQEAIKHLSGLLRSSDTCLEWGSGRSTVWLAARTAKVHSIEHDLEWFDRVREGLSAGGADVSAIELLDAGTVTVPPEQTPYVRVVDRFGDDELTVCIVDGEHREQCALAAVPKLARGGLLLVDDAHWFLDRPTHSPHSRTGKGPFSDGWRQFETLVSGWRCVWTTDGVTDTAIWIKPCG
jgi:predicted O-methyltransferase YrrM